MKQFITTHKITTAGVVFLSIDAIIRLAYGQWIHGGIVTVLALLFIYTFYTEYRDFQKQV